MALAQRHEVLLERLEAGAAHDALGQWRQHQLTGHRIAHDDPLAGAVLQQVRVRRIDLEAGGDAGDRQLCRWLVGSSR